MTSKMLQKARDFEKKYLPYTLSEQPGFHVTGGIGWINDPNGFAPYKGEYHLFFQYYPYDTKWGPMHWGHVKTRDFIHWDRLPAALAPDMDYDRDGCFSGSAVRAAAPRISATRRSGVRATASMPSSATAPPTAAATSSFTKARMPANGSSSACLPPATTSTAACGSARTSSRWTEKTSCSSLPRR